MFENRTKNLNGMNQHCYDILFGVMSDSLPTILFLQYENGEISKEKVIEGLKKSNSMKQLSLHNQGLCDIIKPKKAYCYNINSSLREELDINEYKKRCQFC